MPLQNHIAIKDHWGLIKILAYAADKAQVAGDDAATAFEVAAIKRILIVCGEVDCLIVDIDAVRKRLTE